MRSRRSISNYNVSIYYLAIVMIGCLSLVSLARGGEVVGLHGKVVVQQDSHGVVKVFSCGENAANLSDCSAVGDASGYYVSDLQRYSRNQKWAAAGIGTAETAALLAAPAAGFYAGAELALASTSVISGSGMGGAVVNLIAGGLNAFGGMVVGTMVGGAAGIGADTVLLLIDATNPVSRWKKANAVAAILRARQEDSRVKDIYALQSRLEKALSGVTPAAKRELASEEASKPATEAAASAAAPSAASAAMLP